MGYTDKTAETFVTRVNLKGNVKQTYIYILIHNCKLQDGEGYDANRGVVYKARRSMLVNILQKPGQALKSLMSAALEPSSQDQGRACPQCKTYYDMCCYHHTVAQNDIKAAKKDISKMPLKNSFSVNQ